MGQFVTDNGMTSLPLLLSALSLGSHILVNIILLFSNLPCILTTSPGAIPVSSGAFGDDIESAVLYDIDCLGNETGVLNCSLSHSGTCPEHSAAVICQGMSTKEPDIRATGSILADLSTSSSNCTDGELRLSGAITSNQGRLEVCMNGAWGSVCDSEGVFSKTEAKVACRQLGKLQIEGTCS